MRLSFVGGLIVISLIIFLTFGTLLAVTFRMEGFSGLARYDWAVIKFTCLQAFISALTSLILAIPISRALVRRNFIGRRILITLLGAPFILPVIVAILGLIAVFGRTGLLSDFLGFFNLKPLPLYGLQGVIIAHVFFNLPLAVRLLLQGWLSIPAERFRLGHALNFSPLNFFKYLEVPMLTRFVPGAFLLIFLICTTSFAVALALGGGPKATTVELSIYQAFRFEFDLSRVAVLALIQFLICGLIAILSFWIALPTYQGSGLDRVIPINFQGRIVDFIFILGSALFLILPLFMIVFRGSHSLFLLPEAIFMAAFRSICVALFASLLTVVMGLFVASLLVYHSKKFEIIGYLPIAASPLVIGVGLFIMSYQWMDPARIALPAAVLINALMCVPFVLRAILPTFIDIEKNYGRLADSLRMSGWTRFRWLLWPRLRRSVGFCMGLAAALSMGDLGVIALFADPNHSTLPLEIYRLMTAYRMNDAYGAALLLLLLSVSLFWIFDRGGRLDANS